LCDHALEVDEQAEEVVAEHATDPELRPFEGGGAVGGAEQRARRPREAGGGPQLEHDRGGWRTAEPLLHGTSPRAPAAVPGDGCRFAVRPAAEESEHAARHAACDREC